MNTKLNREKLTAYVLGELEPEERDAVEQALQTDEEARREVDEIRAAAKLMEKAFGPDPEISLTDTQRDTIHRTAEESDETGTKVVSLQTERRKRQGAGWWLARAAAVLLVVGGAGYIVVQQGPFNWRDSMMLDSKIGDSGTPVAREDQSIPRSDAQYAVPKEKGGETKRDSQHKGPKDRFTAPGSDAMGRKGIPDSSPADASKQTAVVPSDAAVQAPYSMPDSDASAPVSRADAVMQAPLTPPERMKSEEAPMGKKGTRRQVSTSLATGMSEAVIDGEVRNEIGGVSAPSMFHAERERETDDQIDRYGYGGPGMNTEAYDRIVDNPFLVVTQNPLSTFSIDVDTASYANIRRFLNQGMLPPKDAVRIEEMINYFDYDYEPPRGETPFDAHVVVAGCPWNREHRLARVGLKGRELAPGQRPAGNLVFLLDVSGSMNSPDKLPLLKEAMKLLVNQLDERDRVSIAVYAGASGQVLPPTPGDRRHDILGALNRLHAGGSTNGGAGIELAYQLAQAQFIEGGLNRVILATDGDFNVGTTNHGDLTRLIEEKAKSGVFLSVLGFGTGNLKDSTMERLADKGNGNYAYIDTLEEARKVLVEEMGSTLVTIAKDVKIQIEFNPAQVGAYRLIGYENRILAAEDFNDDTKDAGEIGAGHTVTALYQLVPAGVEMDLPGIDPLKYQQPKHLTGAAAGGDLFTIKLRYKEPDSDTSKLLSFPVKDNEAGYADAPDDFKFAAAVAAFGMLLRDSEYAGNASFGGVWELAEEGMGRDRHGYRAQFLELVEKAKALKQPHQQIEETRSPR